MGSGLSASRRPGMTWGRLMPYWVYLMASKKHGTLYLGVTSDLSQRVHQHRTKAFSGFSARYGVDRLVWSEEYDDISEAIAREKDIKKWRRDWKIRLIEQANPNWLDLGELLSR
jgi:putative endonuclease